MILFMLLVLLPAIVFIPRDNHWALPLEVCVVWLTAMLSTVTVAVYFGRQGS